MANFGLIDFKLGLYIKINVNGKTNLKFISQNRPSIGTIGQTPLLGKNINLA